MRNAYTVLFGKLKERALEDLGVVGEITIRMDLREIGWEVMN
jgi:hypothetical protein